MIVGLILAGSFIGGASALTMLMLGHSIWIALLIYSAAGALSVLAGALALSARSQDWAEDANPHLLVSSQRG